MTQSGMTSAAPPQPHTASPHSRKSVYMVVGCTVFAAVAQVLMKKGMAHTFPALQLGDSATWAPLVMALLTDIPLILGFCAHSMNALLLILALRDGELSMLFPIISLSYVWVSLLSMYFFHEPMNLWKAVGILLVISGVALLGRASSRA